MSIFENRRLTSNKRIDFDFNSEGKFTVTHIRFTKKGAIFYHQADNKYPAVWVPYTESNAVALSPDNWTNGLTIFSGELYSSELENPISVKFDCSEQCFVLVTD